MTPQELKNSILQLAIQGKLVEQRPEEGTGEELYKQIQAEKAKLIKEGKIKKEKPLPLISDDEIPFEIPESWMWCYLGEVFNHNTGKAQNASDTRDGVVRKFITTSNLYWNRFDFTHVKEMRFTEQEIERCTARKGDLLVCEGGDYGRSAIWQNSEEVCFQNHVHRLRAYVEVDVLFFYHIFFLYKTTGQLKGRGVAIQGLSSNALHEIKVPLPPLSEQKRIVAKIEELLPLVEQYEKTYNRLEQLNKQFPDDMKKSILQLAIQGKLVEQRPEEGTGEELYKQIQAEKAKLIKEGKIKKEKPLPPISEDEIPFEIPDNWKWVRLGSEMEIARGGSPRPIKEYLTQRSDGLNWIKIGDSVKGSKYINSTAEKILPSGLHKTRFVQKGDFILSNSMSFGRPYILNIDGCIHDGWLVLHQYYPVYDKDFLFYLLSSPMVFKQFCDRVAGAVVNNLNSDKASLTMVPLPPISEQKRIAAKIEELLPLCDLLRDK